MKTVNLIPAARLAARRRRTQLQRCVAGCVVYAGLVLAAAAAARVVWATDEAAVPRQMEEVSADNAMTEQSIGNVKAELQTARSLLRASRSITEQPDWSALLALLASKTGEDVVLKACTVRPRDPDRAPAPPTPPRGGKPAAAPVVPAEPVMTVSITGLGLTQGAVSQFVLRLEATGLFGKVTLIETTRETFERGDAVAFRAECSLEAPAANVARPTSPPWIAATPSDVPAARRDEVGGIR